MARLLGTICTSHVPAIGGAIARGAQDEPYWKPFFDGYPPVRDWLAKVRPDAVVLIYNDHGLHFFLDNLPTFAVGAAFEYRNADEGWGLPTVPPYPGDPKLSWHVIESLVGDELDIATCQEMRVDHAFTVPMQLLWPDRVAMPGAIVPVAINTVQHPLPSAARCFKLGRAIGRAIESYPEDIGVVVLGTGGLSHQLDGERAGFINREFDLECLDKIPSAPEALLDYTIRDIVRLAGTQGVELIMWLAARGALNGRARTVHRHYHVPISNTAGAVLALEPES